MLKAATLTLASVSLVAMTAPAFGQASPPQASPAAADALDDTGELAPSNEIVVSARRREESVQDVPQTVNVVTSAQIEKLNLRNFTEISAVVPGLTLTPGASFGSSATLRGVAFSPEASGNNPTVEFYVNDGPVSSNFVFQSLFDVGQFEVQRGPQGTLRGRASPSGSILFTTRRPDLDEFGGVLNMTLTDTHSYKVDGAVNVPIIKDVLGVRVAGVIDETEGRTRVRTIKQLTQPEFNPDPKLDTRALRVSVLFEPTDWITANVMYQTLNTKSRSYTQVQSLCLVTGATCPTTSQTIRPFDRLSIEDQGGAFVQQHDVLVGNLDIRFAGQRLSYVGSYNRQNFNALGTSDAGDFYTGTGLSNVARTFRDATGADNVCGREGARAGVRPTLGEFYQCTNTIARRFSHEIRLSSEDRIAGIFDYVVGALFDRTKGDVLNLTQETAVDLRMIPPPNGGFVFVDPTAIIRTGGDSRERSFFANLTAHVTDQLELSGGIRHISYKADPNVITVRGVTNGTPGVDESATVYMGSVKYQITPDIMVYATIGSSYRPGPRVIGNFSTGPTGQGPSAREQQFLNLPAERSTSYEIGAKTSFLDRRGRLNVSLYRQDFDNFVFRGPGVVFRNYERNSAGAFNPTVGTFNFVSAVPVRVEGAEVEASFQIMERWSLGLNASYSNGRIKGGTIACTDLDQNGVPDANPQTPANTTALNNGLPAGQNVSICTGYNSRASFAPKFSANLQTEYAFDFSDHIGGFVRGLFNFTGENSGDPNNAFDNVDAYGLLNLYAGVRDADGAWEITAYGKNILREQRVLFTTSNPTSTTVRTPFGSSTFASPYVPVTVTAPREFGLSFRVALGSR